jgi:hypothetical protein
MDTMERYHIYKETQLNNQTNDKNIIKPNIIFETPVHNNMRTECARQTSPGPPTNASVIRYSAPIQHVPPPKPAQRKYHNYSIQNIMYKHSHLTSHLNQ